MANPFCGRQGRSLLQAFRPSSYVIKPHRLFLLTKTVVMLLSFLEQPMTDRHFNPAEFIARVGQRLVAEFDDAAMPERPG